MRNELLFFFLLLHFSVPFPSLHFLTAAVWVYKPIYMEIMSFQVLGSGGVSVRAAAVVVTDWAGFGKEGQRGWSIVILCASWAALLAIVGLFSGFVVFLLFLVLHISSFCVVISLLAPRKYYLKWIRVPGQIASGFVFGRRSFQPIWRSDLLSLSLSLSLYVIVLLLGFHM